MDTEGLAVEVATVQLLVGLLVAQLQAGLQALEVRPLDYWGISKGIMPSCNLSDPAVNPLSLGRRL